KTAGRTLEYVDADLLAPAAARMYFQRLEAEMRRTLGTRRSRNAAYLYMSIIGEMRALWCYRLYQEALKRLGRGPSLKRILGEEENHLLDVANRLATEGELSDERAARFLDAERRLYERLLRGLELAAAWRPPSSTPPAAAGPDACGGPADMKIRVAKTRIVLLVAVVFLVALPPVFGMLTESAVRKRAESLRDEGRLLVTVETFDRGWFTSRAVLSIEPDPTGDRRWQTLTGFVRPMTVVVDFKHGPLSVHDGLFFG